MYDLNGHHLTSRQVLAITTMADLRQREVIRLAGEALFRSLADAPDPSDYFAALVPAPSEYLAEIEDLAAEWLDLAAIIAAADVNRDGSIREATPETRADYDAWALEEAVAARNRAAERGESLSRRQAALQL